MCNSVCDNVSEQHRANEVWGCAAGTAVEIACTGHAKRGLEGWQAAVDALNDSSLSSDVRQMLAELPVQRLLEGVFGGSPFLQQVAAREPRFLALLLERGPDEARSQVEAEAEQAYQAALSGEHPGTTLRIAKRRLSLLTAVADIAGVWSLEQVTGAFSDFADRAIVAALAYAVVDAARHGSLRLGDARHPLKECGLVVLGMGKLGARELNYSSDVDLVMFYDPDRFCVRNADTQQRDAIRLGKSMARTLSDRTAEGYVFRTDFRLRPDPGATPIAVSVNAAEEYYETLGQNWERAALIKARAVAGDLSAARAFLLSLRPFIWRKHLDFAAIQDIHSIKRQIDAHRGGGKICIAGHNVKLGRGGIREIEFFAQTQQLIWGGRIPSLRVRGTVEALQALAYAGKISEAAALNLAEDYAFLRRLEHRLQMVHDEQTHAIPSELERLAQFARFFGFTSADAFGAALIERLRRVESHYAMLFEDAPDLIPSDALGGNLAFTGGEADPDTLETLARLGFNQPATVDAAVRGWHHGRCRAMRSTRARELLTEMMPQLLKALSTRPDPDGAFIAFDRFLHGLPAGVQLFSMLHANPSLLELLADILGVAPALADHLARTPSVLESVLSAPDFFRVPPDVPELAAELDGLQSVARDAEELLDISRRWANDRKFQIGTLMLTGALDSRTAGRAWSRVAEAALTCLLPRIEAEFVRSHGRVPGCHMAILGMGKLGGGEMTATSDLDLIFVYGAAEGDVPLESMSDGPKPLPAAQYFARLSQRLINSLSAPTAEGRLYDVDMRLRPSGKAGPIAVSVRAFERYHEQDAWTWEQMALTRARVVAGPFQLAARIDKIIRSTLCRPRDTDALVLAVAEMRERMATELGTNSLWQVKHLRGGLVDIEFIAQYLQLRHAHQRPDILSTNTRDALQKLCAAGVLPANTTDDLVQALDLWQAVQSRVRLTVGHVTALGRDDAPQTLRVAMEGLRGHSFDSLVDEMTTAAERVHDYFQQLIDAPAATIQLHARGENPQSAL